MSDCAETAVWAREAAGRGLGDGGLDEGVSAGMVGDFDRMVGELGIVR